MKAFNVFCLLASCGPYSLYAQPALKLNELVAEALENNPEIRSAQKRYEAARQRPNQESSLPDPVFSPGYSSNGNPLPGAGLGSEPTSNIGFTLSQQIPLAGKRRLRGDIASKEAEAEFDQYDAVRLAVVARLKQAYHRLHHTYVAIEILNQGKDLLTQSLRIAEARYAAGKAMQQDTFKAQAQLSILETRILRMQQDRRAAEAELNSILNRKPGSALAMPETGSVQPIAFTLDQLIAKGRSVAPAILRDQKMIQRGQLAVNLARKQALPDYTISAGYYNMGRMPDMFQFRVDIPLPVFASRKQIPAINEQVHRLSEARQSYQAELQNYEFRIRESYAIADTSFRLLALYQDTVIPQTELAMESSLIAYQNGAADFLTVLSNLTAKIDYEERYHEEMLAYWAAVIRLEEITGLALLR